MYGLSPIPLEEARHVLCYPQWYPNYCNLLLERLRKYGVRGVVSLGKMEGRGIRILGKGHAAIVVAVLHEELGIVAAKIRRFDSKRPSMVHEANLLKVCERTGCVPRVYISNDLFVIRELVEGPTLKELLLARDRSVVKQALLSLLGCVHKIGLAAVEITEISLPLSQVIYREGDPSKPVVVDLESARINPCASNVTRVLGFILGRSVAGVPVRTLLDLEDEDVLELRRLARRYKECKDERGCKEEVFAEILNAFRRRSL
ncbi:MAG: hypothetical protein DRO12_00140 [Thermoprotei archaeon]|nr:MAG: hypothetical protein DRO12_00140 [Thermoprotei archaeon]